nr:MAG TPA: hypothetical protein [Inoviridae sp.]
MRFSLIYYLYYILKTVHIQFAVCTIFSIYFCVYCTLVFVYVFLYTFVEVI